MRHTDESEVYMSKKSNSATPVYIARLLQPRSQQAADRRVWSIPLGGVWLPFFTATNTAGETSIPAEALGAPLRLAKDKDGTPKLSASGRPVFRVVREIADQVRLVRENFAAGLLAYAEGVRKAMPDQYKAQVEATRQAGEPIVQKDMDDLDAYIKAMTEAQAPDESETIPTPISEPEKELVPA